MASVLFLNRLFNTVLRLGSLGSKLVLTLYMGKYLGLSEMGTYGLVAAYVTIAIPLLGQRLDYCVSRDIIDTPPLALARMMRDQAVYYGLNYVLMAVAGLGYIFTYHHGVGGRIVLLTLALSILESFATITSSNLVSLNRPILSNFLFFVRAALWTLPVIGLGLISPAFRTADTIFMCWIAGVVASLAITFAVWRDLPWLEALRLPIDWAWIRHSVRKSFFIWLGAVGLASALNVDRFFVEHYLGRDFVGIASFYGSFTVAIPSLLTSGIFAFTYPRLISLHRQGEHDVFHQEVKKMTLHAMLAAGFIALAVGIVVPFLGSLFSRPEFTDHAPTLWLLLLAVWIRCSTESLYYVMYARHQDRDIWIGNLALLGITAAGNAVLIPALGFRGIGYSAVLAAMLFSLWRIHCVRSRASKGFST